jgi:hypothetical protein
MGTTKILTTSGMAVAISLLGLSAIATPAEAHPCVYDDGRAFACIEPDGEEGIFVCAGTYTDDNDSGSYDHKEENTYICTNGKTA